MATPAPKARLANGFTLIELMITVAVVAILAAVAMPSYTEHIMRSHRSNARTTLLGAAQWMERAATVRGSYPVTGSVTSGILNVEGNRYTVTFTATGQTFSFTASPLPGTAQINDKCGSLSIDQAGTKSVTGASLSAAECWSR